MLQGYANDDSIHLVATIPPPAGESDAYSAATRLQEPLANIAALMRCGEEDEVDVEIHTVPFLFVAGPLHEASNDHGPRAHSSFGSAREWLVVAGLAVMGASVVLAVSLAF